MYGWTSKEAQQQSMQSLLHGKFPTPCDEILASVKAQEAWSGEVTYTRHNGAPVTVASRWTLRRNAEGVAKAIVEFATDITERKLAEIRVREFHSSVSHELRTPLTAIRAGFRSN